MEQIVQLNSNANLSKEKNRYGAVWVHFAVRPKERSATQGDACLSKNRRKVAFLNA